MKFLTGTFYRVSWLYLALLLAACAPALGPGPAIAPAAASTDQFGIEIVGLYLSSRGYMLDFRYQVKDAAKAAPMIDRALIPYLIHEASGAKFAVPSPAKVGPLRQMPRQLEAGKQYFILFANPGQYVKAGDLVTVVIGDMRFEHLRVE